jgi:hypothetical protein
MPKDATKNVDRYKVRGGQINEFDFHRNQEQFAEQKDKSPLATKSTKGTKKAARGSTKSATAKKRTAGKAAKKQAGRKATKK